MLAGNITLFPPSKDTLTTVIVFIITLTVGHVTVLTQVTCTMEMMPVTITTRLGGFL